MNTKEQDLYNISQPRFYIFVTKHLGKILFLSFLLMFIVAIAYQENFEYIKRLFHIVIVFSVIGLILDRYFRRIAFKIIIDFKANTIEFYLCRSGEVKKFSFDSIEAITSNKYANFVFENERVLYSVSQDEGFNHAINRIKAHLSQREEFSFNK